MSNFQCPSCGKTGFKDQVAVARHMSQPCSGCSTWLQDLIHLRDLSDDSMHTDDLDEPNIPGAGPQAEVEFTFRDIDESFEGSGESGGQASGEGLLPNGADFVDCYPESSWTYGKGYTFLDLFNSDENSVYRAKNPYYPFSGWKDWEIASWLLHSGLSMGKIDSFLSLEMIKGLPLSFSSAKELRGRAEMLPSGPRWMSQVLSMSHPTKSPVVLYWRDPLDCISAILNHPFFHDRLDFMPRRVYTTAQHLCCVYSEWMTGDDTWNMQSALPEGATLLGTILSSDKTNISTMTGDRVAHPLLISLANINMSTQLKTSSNTFVLTALLPVPKFIHKNKCMQGVLEDRLIHECLDIVLRPLKQAACEGVMLSDPVGHSRYCFTPLVSYIVDTPEAMMLATVGGKTSPVTMAMFKQFGDPFRHEPHTESTTLAQLAVVQTRADPNDIEAFFRKAQKFSSNGVSKPFWQDWTLVGDMEIDFRFSVLQPVTGFHHFDGGISKLKQSPRIDEDDIKRISGALDEFHANKYAITAGGFRRGNKNKVIDNWYIPKLELMQSIVPSIRNTGVAMQWTADTTEHAHITEIKDPVRSSNNNNYDPQICRHLDRVDKCRRFDLAMSLVNGLASSGLQDDDIGDDVDFDADDDDDLPTEFMATIKCPGHSHPITNYFAIAKILQHKEVGTVPLPLHTFVIGRMAFHLTYSPSIRSISVNNAAIKFGLPDLRLAIADFLHREATHGQNHVHTIGGARRAGPTASLPFDKIQIWYNSVIVNNELGCLWPAHGLRGHTIGQIRLIMCPVGRINTDWSWRDRFLVYMYRFDVALDQKGEMFQWYIKAPVNLIPRFGASADSRFTSQNSMEHASEFWVNKFWDKNTSFPLSILEYTEQMPPQFFFRTGGYGIKLSSLVLLPATVSGDALTMNKYTAEELNCLVTQEDEPSELQSLGHILSHIFQPFSIPLPDLSMLQIPLKNILHHNECTKAKFSENSPDDLVPLYDADAQLWNWNLPTLAPTNKSESTTHSQPSESLDLEDNAEIGEAAKPTHEEIFSSFFNTLAICLVKAEPKLLANPTATRTWTAAHAHKPLPGSEVKWKPDLLLSDEITANWGNIRVSAELTHSSYQPALRLVKAADTHAYLMLSEQPWRRFALVLSLTNEYRELRVLFYNDAGGVVSPAFNIYQKPSILTHIIAVLRFGSLECIGYDLTVSFTKHISPPQHHTNGYRPIKNLPAKRQPADHVMAAATSEPPNPPRDDFEGAPSAVIESISPDTEPEPESDSDSESCADHGTYISMKNLEDPPLVQATAISSAPLLNLASQAPEEPDSIYSATPHPSQFPYSAQSPEPCGKICVRDTIYTITRILFASRGLVSRGTVCYLVSLDDKEFIIKDHWVQGKEDQVILNEIEMLKHMSGIPGVPELVDWWVVEKLNGEPDVTSKYRKQPQCPSIAGTSHSHVRLVLTPCACPLHMFRTLKEFVKALRDIIIIQCTAVEERKVLHCDCSLNNAMIVDLLGGGSRGFLIDWEFAVRINPDLKYAIGGTGTIPFMSHGLLAQLSDAQQAALGGKKPKYIPKTSSNALALPVLHDSLRNSIPDRWNNMDLESCAAFKGNFFATKKEERRLVDEIHPYFKDLIPLAKEWHTALKDNMENPVSFDTILTLLNTHLDRLPDDEDLVSTVKTLKQSAAILTDCVEKHVASQSFPMELPKCQKSDGISMETDNESDG
ncbi:uncharacterized protein F5147DRAFT_653992 [Suillus discolor]|uniref:Fungal-type protein kinase domain-containing protein n=1 Tax=Suillus discolor TaxID=1912936 RepID=A0A9P7F505_9AGAM|nr:uncharacterized protein F5147DRAFT_653992 [Suillus discolor]KAG2106248.1 hypothetical protein F5147DRAFT_653992 [Suillus discolor]